jgi:hypothetical protein
VTTDTGSLVGGHIGFERGRRVTMKRIVGGIGLILVLTLALAIPAGATKPTAVSGAMTDAHRVGPPQVEPRGGNCLLTMGYWHKWGLGSFRGEDEVDFRIMAHGRCEDVLPNLYRENLKGMGTYVGDLCLGGEWEEGVCSGEMYSGSFDFTLQWQTTPNPDPTAPTTKGTIVILQGYEGFEGLQGVLDFSGRVGSGGWSVYEGQVHVEP